jgi:hypothetical protein
VHYRDTRSVQLDPLGDQAVQAQQPGRIVDHARSSSLVTIRIRHSFDLGPWLRSGKLLWIAPGDTTLTLREGEAGCPLVGLTGSRHMAHIREGRVWRSRP